MPSLNIALSELFDTHVSMYTFSPAITSSFLLLYLSFLHGESDHVSYMTDKSSCLICKLKVALGHLCVVLTVQGFIPSSNYYPDSIIILSKYYLCLPSLIQFLVTLLIHWRIYFLPHHSMVSYQYFLKMKTQSFDNGTLGFTIIFGEILCFSCQFHLLFENLLNPFLVRLQHIYSHGLDCTGSFVFFTHTLGSHL